MSNAHQTRVPATALHAVVARVYQACGMGETDAALMADSHIGSDLRGAHSHGVLRVPGYVSRLREGGVDPQGQPSLSRHFGACLVVDGGMCSWDTTTEDVDDFVADLTELMSSRNKLSSGNKGRKRKSH